MPRGFEAGFFLRTEVRRPSSILRIALWRAAEERLKNLMCSNSWFHIHSQIYLR